MAGFWGMDVAEMQRLQSTLTGTAAEINAVVGELDSTTGALDWRGPDADDFRMRTWPAVKADLTKLASAFSASADQVRSQIAQQTAASQRGR